MSLSEDLREFAGVVELLEEHGVEVRGARSIQTVIELTDRPQDEQQYVRKQVNDE